MSRSDSGDAAALTDDEREQISSAVMADDIDTWHALIAAVELIIAKRVTTARAETWTNGYLSGYSNAMRRMSDEPDAPTTPNPYRSTENTST